MCEEKFGEIGNGGRQRQWRRVVKQWRKVVKVIKDRRRTTTKTLRTFINKLLTNTVGTGMLSGMSPVSGIIFTGTSRDVWKVTGLWPWDEPFFPSNDSIRAVFVSSAALLLFVLGAAPSFRTVSFM